MLAIVGMLTLGLVTGCSSQEPGEALPTPAGDGASPSTGDSETSPPSGAEPTVTIPARPADLPLDGVEPCSLFTDPQLAELGIDREPRSGSNDGELKGPTCSLDVASKEPFYMYTAQLITHLGIDTWLTGKRNVDASLVTVGGYPAVNFRTKGVDDEECITTVDVAEGQQLMIDLYPLESVDYKQLCPLSEKAAAMALRTLQTLR